VHRLRRIMRHEPGRNEDYGLARRVYRATLMESRNDYIRDLLGSSKDPDIFRLVRQLDSRRTLPSMVNTQNELVSTHEGIAALVAEQLSPGEPSIWSPPVLDVGIDRQLEEGVRLSPTNTGPGIDDIGYPMIRFWMQEDRHGIERLMDYGMRHDIADWHMAEVVLIPKADKTRYDIVKSWRMIHLLPTLAKVAERIILQRIAAMVDLGDTQFGSRRKRSCHDAISIVYEFLRYNRGMKCAMLSIDVEGGFDNVNIDHLSDFLVARGCSNHLTLWVRRWASNRSVRFRFNGRVSRVFHLCKGIPQGSPLSPFLFGANVADIFEPRILCTPVRRRITVSYVDDGVIIVAADTEDLARYTLTEAFDLCNTIAGKRGMGFSPSKIGFIGFGDRVWDGLAIGGIMLQPSEDLRVLG